MKNTDKEIIGTLLKSVFDKGLVSETAYRNAQNRLRTFDATPLTSYSGHMQHEKKECIINGHTEN